MQPNIWQNSTPRYNFTNLQAKFWMWLGWFPVIPSTTVKVVVIFGPGWWSSGLPVLSSEDRGLIPETWLREIGELSSDLSNVQYAVMPPTRGKIRPQCWTFLSPPVNQHRCEIWKDHVFPMIYKRFHFRIGALKRAHNFGIFSAMWVEVKLG